MTVLWSLQKGNAHYEVRAAGRTRRLYTNGVFHSQWNPRRVISDSLWDLLTLPAFFLAPGLPKRILILGLGGGAVALQLHKLFKPEQMVCVELDCVHISVAQRWFGLNKRLEGCDVDLIQADAAVWLADYSGPAFDYIVDDLFSHTDGEAARAIDIDQVWSGLLCRHLAPNGVLAINLGSIKELNLAASSIANAVKPGVCKSFYSFSHPRYHNRIAVLATHTNTTLQPMHCDEGSASTRTIDLRRQWRDQLQASHQLSSAEKRIALGLRCRSWVLS